MWSLSQKIIFWPSDHQLSAFDPSEWCEGAFGRPWETMTQTSETKNLCPYPASSTSMALCGDALQHWLGPGLGNTPYSPRHTGSTLRAPPRPPPGDLLALLTELLAPRSGAPRILCPNSFRIGLQTAGLVCRPRGCQDLILQALYRSLRTLQRECARCAGQRTTKSNKEGAP